ncbi:uroporphyrinogen-III C-methyltransferase [Aureibacillus halotolerans]|uniref:Uroporphyrinogen-III C-methyltransferase n=1 Tax=Aureibacillus halotolerans TaxID=1508390 RepID=A0A4R6UHG4_9BACI|nr:uroporphyrinogen-III C-methyltransferase [Aureibacillus halotolerans]TDQ42594.1 uroporphyrinogen-III C-methyltransferase [Aureibacillus halotolerans]
MGKVYLVGAGPGDPDLITVKALKAIQAADTILYDRLVNPELLREAKPEAHLVYCGKSPGYHAMTQETINRLLVKYGRKSTSVVRLKGGDPFVFGRGAEEAEALARAGVEYEVVPGITAGIAAPAYADIPVTHRTLARSFAIVTGHQKKGEPENVEWGHLAKAVDTLVIYMGIKNLRWICERLLLEEKAASTPVAIVQQGTTDEQKTVTGTLGTICEIARAADIQNPAVIVIGDVVSQHTLMQELKATGAPELQELYV